MHVFMVFDDEWIIAKDMDDAVALCTELYGVDWWHDMVDDINKALVQCDDKSVFTIRVMPNGEIAEEGDQGYELLTLTMGEWAQREPRGAFVGRT